MFVVNFRVTKQKLVVVAMGFAAVVLLAVSLFTSGARVSPKGADTADRTAFLYKLGYKAVTESEAVTEIVIPKNFGETYKAYNSLQESAGFQLSDFRGKKAIMYTYRLDGFADNTQAYANLIVRNGKIIGGDISSIENGGFTLPLVESNKNLKELAENNVGTS